MKIAVVQINARNNKEENLNKLISFIEDAAKDGADLVSLPEYATFLGNEEEKISQAESIPNGHTSEVLMEKAKELGVYIHVGSILEKADAKKSYNTSLFINNKGELTATYRKVHLFDIDIEDRVAANESNTVEAGDTLVTAETSFGTVGLSICYDIRFPELFRSLTLKGAKILFIPAAFTQYTGTHHWEVLLRARAIENQCYVVAAGQIGSFLPGKSNFGSSMIIDPWGTVIARAPEEEGFVSANINLERINKVRKSVPCLSHRKPDLYLQTNN